MPDRVTWLGHATALIEMGDVRLLTDPVVTPWAGPLRNHVPSAVRGAGVTDVDAVLISHVHPDHLHLASLRRVARGARHVIVPQGAAPIVDKALRGRARVEEMAIGQRTKAGSVVVEATYAEHKAARPGVGRVMCLGYLIGQDPQVYFAGDTNFFDGMAELSDDIDLALLPVGGWWVTLGPGHMDALRAAQALELLRPRAALPIHWGTLHPPAIWRLRPRLQTQPGPAFVRHAARLTPDVTVHVPEPGTPVALVEA
jgi:L-ascorbate metabolism protein UlaG (beta-lactamase superfamily)